MRISADWVASGVAAAGLLVGIGTQIPGGTRRSRYRKRLIQSLEVLKTLEEQNRGEELRNALTDEIAYLQSSLAQQEARWVVRAAAGPARRRTVLRAGTFVAVLAGVIGSTAVGDMSPPTSLPGLVSLLIAGVSTIWGSTQIVKSNKRFREKNRPDETHPQPHEPADPVIGSPQVEEAPPPHP